MRTVQQALVNRRWTRDIQEGSIPCSHCRVCAPLGQIGEHSIAPGMGGRHSLEMDARRPLQHPLGLSDAAARPHDVPGSKPHMGLLVPLRVKLFLWIACKYKTWTADRRRRHGLQTHDVYLLCDQVNETVDHLLVTCLVAKEVYFLIFSWAQCSCSFGVQASLHAWWEHLVTTQTARRRPGAFTLFMVVAWHLWKERNARLFDQRSATTQVIIDRIKLEASLWVTAGARDLGRLFCE